MASRVLSRVQRTGVARRLILASSQERPLGTLSSGFRSLSEPPSGSSTKAVSCQFGPLFRHSVLTNAIFQRFGFSSTGSPQTTEKESNQSVSHDGASQNKSESKPSTKSTTKPTETTEDSTASEQTLDADAVPDLSFDDLVKLVAEKEELLKLQQKEIEIMQDKVVRSFAEMENVIDRTKREAENSKKFAIQNFAKSLLDVADNLERASSVVKESFSKIDTSKDTVGAVPLLKTLLEGVEMTVKQLQEVFRRFGVEKFDPMNEQFDPNKHLAVFQVPDASKPPGTVAVVLKAGYMLYDRILRPAEVGVTQALDKQTDQSSSA